MTKSEIVNQYVRGDLDRRGFIRKLTAIGVSSGAAAVYATSLVQPAAASTAQHGSAFIARAQQPDGLYGIAVAIENLIAAIGRVLARLRRIQDMLDDLFDSFGFSGGQAFRQDGQAVDLSEQDLATIQTIRSQIEEQSEAISVSFGTTADTSASGGAQTGGTQQEKLVQIANALNENLGVYAALIPNIENGEEQQLMTNVALASARHAAIMSNFAGLDPVPSAFVEPIDPATLN